MPARGADGINRFGRSKSMPQMLSQLPPIHLGYLMAVTGAFLAFAVSLGVTHIASNLPDRRR